MRCAVPRPTRPPRAWSLAAALGLVCGIVTCTACGRQATEADCDLIVDRYVEVELKDLKVTDPKVIELRKAEMRKDLKDDLKSCLGKKVTESMMDCVKKAQSNVELDKCTRW